MSPLMTNSGYVYFGLSGDFAPAEVTAFIGLELTERIDVGERRRFQPKKDIGDENDAEPATGSIPGR